MHRRRLYATKIANISVVFFFLFILHQRLIWTNSAIRIGSGILATLPHARRTIESFQNQEAYCEQCLRRVHLIKNFKIVDTMQKLSLFVSNYCSVRYQKSFYGNFDEKYKQFFLFLVVPRS